MARLHRDVGPAHSASPQRVSLPASATITVPSSTVPSQQARVSGTWRGWACAQWRCDIALAVEPVLITHATIVYARAYARSASRWQRARGQFVDDELRVTLPNKSQFIARLRADGDMEMTSWTAQNHLTAAGVLTKRTSDYSRSVERVPLASGHSIVRQSHSYEMVTYKPLGKGPFLTVIFNHGSTGAGDDPKRFSYTWTSLPVARFLVR